MSYVWKVVCRDRAAAQSFYNAVRDSNAARYQLTRTRETQPAPFPGPNGKAEEPRVWAAMTMYPPGRQIELCLTSANEVLVIDAKENLAPALNERFAPGIHFSNP